MTAGVVRLAILFFLCLPLFIVSQRASSQQPSPIESATPETNTGSQAQSEISAEHTKNVEPNSPAALATAIDVEFQIAAKRSAIERVSDQQRLLGLLLKNKDGLQRAFADAKDLDCSTTDAISKLNNDFAIISQSVGIYYLITQDIQKTQNHVLPPIFGNWWMASSKDKCLILQQDNKEAVLTALQELSNISAGDTQRISSLRTDLDALEVRLRSLLSSQAAINTVTRNLPWIIGIIASAAILIILAVRIFAPDLQMEWVASGQVIQFTTVLILLSALMALGLTDILHEQVLGTLLGGIAGYVLAQGVGRATARATLGCVDGIPGMHF